MRNKNGILALLIALVVICAYFLIRTWKANDIRKDAAAFATDKTGKIDAGKKQRYLDSLYKKDVFFDGSTYEQLSKQELGLGLDLQGGMHVIMEVSPVEIVRALAGGSRDTKVTSAINNAIEKVRGTNNNFVDAFADEYKKLASGSKLANVFANSTNRGILDLNSSDSQVISYIKSEVDGAFDRSFRVIQNRVDKFGVANPNLQRIPGTNRIQVELPGVDNPDRVRKLLSSAAKLEFCEVYSPNEVSPVINGILGVIQKMDEAQKAAQKKPSTATATTKADTTKGAGLAAQLTGNKTDSTKVDTTRNANSLFNLFQVNTNQQDIRFGDIYVQAKDTSRFNSILRSSDMRSIIPSDMSFLYSRKPEKNSVTATQDEGTTFRLIAVKDFGNAPIEGDLVTEAQASPNQTQGGWEVTMRMNGEGTRKWGDMTTKNVNERVAVILDGLVNSDPRVNEPITGGNTSISGDFTVEEAQDLENVLKAGKLPAPISIIEESVVGASLGEKAVSAGVWSSIIGLIIVFLFVLIYYNKAGFIANLALLVNAFLLLGVMASIGATLTLPGIAGMVLSIGMAVDANVLIFERVKEELAAGKSFGVAIAEGFKNAMSSIIDSNVTTLITALVLFYFGTGLIKGFATTLVIGIFTSLFAAIFVSRLIFEYMIKKNQKASFSTAFTEKLFKDSNFDFVSRRRTYYLISGTIIVAGIISIFVKGFGLGVDFQGGRTYQVKFANTVSTDAVRDALKGTFEDKQYEVKTYGNFGDNQVLVTTAYKFDETNPAVEEQIKANITGNLGKIAGNKAEILQTSKVGPTIANDTIKSAIYAVIISIILVFAYIVFRFRRLAFGYGAIVALVHDVLIILGVFSILRGFLPFSLDVDQAFVGAVLTIMGYSMNDTVVVFDRVREYLLNRNNAKEGVATVINNALNSTLSRTAVTGFSTLLVLLVLLIFGGETIRGFVFAMFIGVIVGTYSSLFVATPIVVDAMQREIESEEKKLAAQPVVVETKKKK
jgi:SecD/SecF fusion protein